MNNSMREKAIYRYICALDCGDLDIIDYIYALAENDEILETMIAEVHRSMIDEEDRAIIKAMVPEVHRMLRDFGITVTETS